MSKKKAFSGNTMTLKDFHGGTIPTDLPLPSAPGVVVRSIDRSGYDRTTSWGNPIGRSDHRTRPNSSPATRHFDDKTPFLTHTARIGRNFDEDERKPLDGVSAPRRTISDESFRIPPSRVEVKPENVSSGRFSGRHGSAPVSPLSSEAVSSYSGRVSEVVNVGVSSQNFGASSEQDGSGTYPNAWALRKEVVVGVSEPVQLNWSGASAVSKLAHASALEKVSSGRWQSKQSIQYQTDVEVNRYSEIESGFRSTGYDDKTANRIDVVGGREYHDATLARHVERSFSIEDGIQGSRKELADYERARAPTYLEVKERKPPVYVDGVQHARPDGKFGGSESQPAVPSEASERPKLKLLPRTKPLEDLEPPVIDSKQVYQRSSDFAHHGHAEVANELHGNMNPAKPGLAGSESVNQAAAVAAAAAAAAAERRKLNLKPRAQPLKPLEGNVERERERKYEKDERYEFAEYTRACLANPKMRNALFGGARPRELVLKERGIDDIVINNHDLGQHTDRIKHSVSRTERVPEHAISSRHSERPDNVHLDQRTVKKSERKDNRVDVERVDMQRRNWRNENRRNGRETDRQQQQERQPSPETWRKPVEQPKPASPDAAGLRYGKAASAVELAQAFSRSFSDPKTDDRYSGKRGIPGRTQMPFSRLMGPTRRTQINGY